MANIILSYIIPAYNACAYIQQTLDAIFALPLPKDKYEVIVVDDCSTDDTLRILQEQSSKHPNVIVLQQERNHRQGAARNRGIEVARGEYIAFCDADDSIVVEGVMNALQALEKSHADICYYDFECQFRNGLWRKFEMPLKTRDTILSAEEYLNNYYTCAFNAPWRGLYRADFLRRTGIRFVEGVRWEDCDWTVKVYAQAKKIQFVSGIGYRYAWNQCATSKLVSPQAMTEKLMAGVRLTLFARQIKDNLPGLSKTLANEGENVYVKNNLSLRNLTKYSASHLREVYERVPAEDWNVIRTLNLSCWEMIVVNYHSLALSTLSILCPSANIIRRMLEFKRNLV